MSGAQIAAHLLATEQRNLALFGYGAKGMTLSMVDTAITLTEGRISSTDIRAVLELGKRVLQHPVRLLPGIRKVLENVANRYPLVLITKGDLFHQEQKVAQSGIADLFQRVEIVSEKSIATYQRILAEHKISPKDFAMVGNSLRSDIQPVLALGGWGVHLPYHVTWAHERKHALDDDEPHRVVVDTPAAIVPALEQLEQRAALMV